MLVHDLGNWREWSVMIEGRDTHPILSRHEDFVKPSFSARDSEAMQLLPIRPVHLNASLCARLPACV